MLEQQEQEPTVAAPEVAPNPPEAPVVPDVSPETAPDAAETAPDDDPEAVELARLEAEADAALNPDGMPAETGAEQPSTEQPGTEQQSEFTQAQKIDYLVNAVYTLEQQLLNQQASQQPATPAPAPEGGNEPGIADIYGSAFETQQPAEASPPENPMKQQLDSFAEQVSRLEGALQGVHAQQASLQQTLQAKAEADEYRAEVQSFQNEYNLTEKDAQRALVFFKQGKHHEGMRFVRGRSQVEATINEQLAQREHDRNLAGRPGITTTGVGSPSSGDKQLESLVTKIEAATNPLERENLVNNLIDKGGSHLLHKSANEIAKGFGGNPLTHPGGDIL